MSASAPPSFGATLWAVLRNELRITFLSPLAYVFLATFLFLAGLFFYIGIALSGEASLRAMMANLVITLLFVMPMVTMRQLAEETRRGTLELLLTSPVPLGALILGKWLATVVLCVVLLLCTLPLPGILLVYGDPDPGVLLTSYLGIFAASCAFAAAGLFTSSLTKDSMVAGVGGILVLLPFWLANAAAEYAPEWAQGALRLFSFLEPLKSFARGVIDSGDVAWFAGFCAIFLFLTWRSLESRRWR